MKIRKIGATGRSYTSAGQGYSIKAAVQEHGYALKVNVDINYNALSDRQAQSAHKMVTDVLSAALEYSAEQRRSNVPLFSLDELEPAKVPHTQGVNER